MKDLRERYPGMADHFLMVAQGGIYQDATLVQTILGSCVAVTFHVPKYQLGATFHGLLPAWREYVGQLAGEDVFRYVDSGVLCLFETLRQKGVKPHEMSCKVFGGSQALFSSEQCVGQRNVQSAYETLARLNLRVASASVGGKRGRKLAFASHTGDVYIKLMRGPSS